MEKMLVNSGTEIFLDGIQLGQVIKLSIETSYDTSFFYCNLDFRSGDQKSYLIRDIKKEGHKLRVYCVNTAELI